MIQGLIPSAIADYSAATALSPASDRWAIQARLSLLHNQASGGWTPSCVVVGVGVGAL